MRGKFMRILVLLNPTNKRGTKAAYTDLRKFLVKDGYILLQSEVFMRITNSRKGAEKHLNRIVLPKVNLDFFRKAYKVV